MYIKNFYGITGTYRDINSNTHVELYAAQTGCESITKLLYYSVSYLNLKKRKIAKNFRNM